MSTCCLWAGRVVWRFYLQDVPESLISWTWAGGFILILGTLIAAWPEVGKRVNAVYPRSWQPQPGLGR